jgi:hypothetical protein
MSESQWSAANSLTTKASHIPNSEEATLSASDKGQSALFGHAVAIDLTGTRVLIGAYQDPVGIYYGAAYVFIRSGTSWSQEAKLTLTGKATGDRLGYSVALDDNAIRAIVGLNAYGGNDNGGVAIFTRSGTTWTQEAILTISDNGGFEGFGDSVASDTNATRIAIGASGIDVSGVNNVGAVYVYLRTGTSWSQEAKIIVADRAASDNLGKAIDIDSVGSRVIASAPYSSPGGVTNAGAAYVFTRSGTSWSQEAKLIANNKANSDLFAFSVGLTPDGTRAIISAHAADSGGFSNAGAAYVFVRSGVSWTQEAILTEGNKALNNFFGTAVAITSSGDKVIIGARGVRVGGVAAAGIAYIFSRSGTTWSQTTSFAASTKATNDFFGNSVDICADGTRLIVGKIYGDPSSTAEAGQAYIFS